MSAAFEEVREIASDLFQVPGERLSPETSPSNLESWDSVQHLNLILALEQRYECEFSPEEIDRMKSLGQIASVVEQKRS